MYLIIKIPIMKQDINRFALFLLLLPFLWVACDKDNDDNPEPVDPPEAVIWQPVPGMESIGALNLEIIDGDLLAMTKSFLFRVDEQTSAFENYYLGNFTAGYATMINERFLVKMENSWIFVFNTQNPDELFGFDIKDHFPDFGDFFFPPAVLGDVIVSNDEDVFLTVYRRKEDGITIAEPQLLLFRAELDAQGKVSVHDIMVSSIDEGYIFGDLIGIHSTGQDFIISLIGGTFKVDPQGNWYQVSENRMYNFIEYGDKLLSFVNDDLFVSYDNGDTWESISTLPYGLLAWQQKGFVWEDEILIWDAYRITRMRISNDALHLQSYCTEGLDPAPGRYLTRMAAGSENMYVATQKGLFYKPLQDFRESQIIP